MEIKDLLKPLEKKLDITTFVSKKMFAKKEFITLLRFSAKIAIQINNAAKKGYNTKFIMDKLAEKGLENTAENITNIILSEPDAINADFDKNYEYNMLSLEAGIDPLKHSFTSEGKSEPLDRAFFEGLQNSNPKLFVFLLKKVAEYQKELELGE